MKLKIYSYKGVKSTNDTAIRLIKQNIKQGIVTSDIQTNGKGQRGKKWVSRRGNLFISIFFPINESLNLKKITFTNLKIIKNILKNIVPYKINIKLPNDLKIMNKKVCGILQEIIYYNEIKFLIIGVGININEKLGDFTDDIKSKATSLNIILNKQHSREHILHSIIYRIKSNTKKINLIHSKWLSYCNHLNRKVNFNYGNKKISGIFMGITNNGNAVININGINKIFQNAEILL